MITFFQKNAGFDVLNPLICLSALLFFNGLTPAHGQDDSIERIVESTNYVLQVQSVAPRRGGIIQQSPGFKLIVRPDTVSCDLPYFGRAYQASYGTTDLGLKFVSADFIYDKEEKKKDHWSIRIRPKGAGAVTQMNLTIYDSGRAQLYVTCSDRESISYNGYIEGGKQK